jgi:hypothetical protein
MSFCGMYDMVINCDASSTSVFIISVVAECR